MGKSSRLKGWQIWIEMCMIFSIDKSNPRHCSFLLSVFYIAIYIVGICYEYIDRNWPWLFYRNLLSFLLTYIWTTVIIWSLLPSRINKLFVIPYSLKLPNKMENHQYRTDPLVDLVIITDFGANSKIQHGCWSQWCSLIDWDLNLCFVKTTQWFEI